MEPTKNSLAFQFTINEHGQSVLVPIQIIPPCYTISENSNEPSQVLEIGPGDCIYKDSLQQSSSSNKTVSWQLIDESSCKKGPGRPERPLKELIEEARKVEHNKKLFRIKHNNLLSAEYRRNKRKKEENIRIDFENLIKSNETLKRTESKLKTHVEKLKFIVGKYKGVHT
jgi:hypothetical protein